MLRVLVFLVCLATYVASNAFTLVVEANREECFYEVIKASTPIGLSFQVSSGGALDLDVTLTDPSGLVAFQALKSTDYTTKLTTSTEGIYTLCFSNKMSAVTDKTVSFAMIVGEAKPTSVAQQGHLTPLERSAQVLSDGLVQIQAEQEYMRMRERAHRLTTESIQNRVLMWSLVEMGVLVGMTVWQVYWLKRHFETKMRV